MQTSSAIFMLPSIKSEDLIANGFLPIEYEGQDGVFYSKTLTAMDMPYFNEHVVDGEYVFKTDRICVEVCPGGMVQLVDQETDYFEEGVHIDSTEGRALLKDAGFV